MDTPDIEFVCHKQYIYFSQSWSDHFAECFASKIWSMLDDEYYKCLVENLFSQKPSPPP